MGGGRRTGFRLKTIDRLLIGAIALAFTGGALLLWLSPPWWGWYLWVLDVRDWPPLKCIGLAVVLVEVVVVMRYWPRTRRRRSGLKPDE